MFSLLTSKKKKKDPETFKEVLRYIQKLESQVEGLKNGLVALTKKEENDVSRVAIIRYNPFGEQGGDQSFSLALLDTHDNGVVISSLFGQNENRVYGKKIEKGVCTSHPLTHEEEEVIKRARGA